MFWIESQVASETVDSIPVIAPSKDLIFGVTEKWFKCKESNEVWRLVSPDFPFSGLWEPLKNGNE